MTVCYFFSVAADWFEMRVSLRRTFTILLLVLFSVATWLYLRQETREFTQTCNQTELFQTQLHKLTAKVHELLRQLELTHFLCFGALWGQIRLSRTLPWADKAEMCLLNEELITKDEIYIYRLFRKNGLGLDYDSTEGRYVVSSESVKPKVYLIVFEVDKLLGMYRRVGWKRRLLPPDCENIPLLQCFPPRLAELPLPLKDFGSAALPVPREEIEIQKYHYRDNWWKETVEFNC